MTEEMIQKRVAEELAERGHGQELAGNGGKKPNSKKHKADKDSHKPAKENKGIELIVHLSS